MKKCTLISELTCDIEKPYYIWHKQGIKLKNCLSYMENDFRYDQYCYNKIIKERGSIWKQHMTE